MLKNAFLSIKKSIGKSILLFLLMAVILNLVIAGLSIKSATTKSMDTLRSQLGNDVTLSYNVTNMMGNREQGEAIDTVMESITEDMADQLKDLDYVESYNYTLSVSASSDEIDPVSMTSDDDSTSSDSSFGDIPTQVSSGDFTISGNTTMAYLEDFTSESSVLSEGRLLDTDDAGTYNCVIEENLASDNELEVGDTITIYTTVDDEEVSVELTIVGIYTTESTSSSMGGMMNNFTDSFNTIYTSLEAAQELNGSESDITSATYYLDDPENIEAFIALAESSSDIDFDTYTLDANDEVYTNSVSSLENIESFANMFLIVVIVAGSIILCLILVLTMRSRFYEFGVMLSLGQSKLKIIGQQLIEIGLIACLAFCLSLGTGKMVSNVISGILEDSQTDNSVVMNMDDLPSGNAPSIDSSDDSSSDSDSSTDSDDTRGGRDFLDMAMTSPTSTELDVSMTTTTVVELAGITAAICVVSILLPSIYILRLSPREILIKKEG